MSFGVTSQGFIAKRTSDVQSEVESDLRAAFGDGIDLDARRPFGQYVGILSERLGSIWEILEQVYNSQYPDSSEGSNLDNVVSITGTIRKDPTKSKLTATLFGDIGTIIPKDSIASVFGNSDARFVLDADVTILAGVDNIQQITFSTIPEDGTITIAFGSEVTTALAFNASATDIQTALENLANIGTGNVLVTGNFSSGTIAIEFQGALAESPQSLLSISANSFTSHEQSTITTIADTAGSLDRTSFIIYDKNGSVGVWIDVDNSGSSPPAAALAANRQLEITGIASGDSDSNVATAIAAILDADPEYSAVAVGNVVTVDDASQGARVDIADSDTGFTVAVVIQGYSAAGLPVTIAETQAGALPQADGTWTSDTEGPVIANAGTLTIIETPVTGWDSVTNALDAILGTDVEADSDLKIRRLQELAVAGRSTTEAIRSKLLGISGVTAAVVFENDTFIVDVDNRPPKSVDIVVQGGVDQDIGDKIFDVVAAGIERIGDISVNVIDSQGFTQVQKFSRPTQINIYVEIDLTVDVNIFPTDGATQAETAIIAHGDSLGIGTDVIVHGSDSLECSLGGIPGINDIVIRIGKTASPTTDANVSIGAREVPDFDTSRITVTTL